MQVTLNSCASHMELAIYGLGFPVLYSYHQYTHICVSLTCVDHFDRKNEFATGSGYSIIIPESLHNLGLYMNESLRFIEHVGRRIGKTFGNLKILYSSSVRH